VQQKNILGWLGVGLLVVWSASAQAGRPDIDRVINMGDIKGQVSYCGEPAREVAVFAPGTSFDARTDTGGNFRISYAQAGTYDLVVKSQGVVLGTIPSVTVKRRRTTDVGPVDFCRDADGDGFTPPEDCNDANPAIFPGAVEACGDGIDNNCSGTVDEGCVICTDLDEDGFFAQDGCGTLIDCDDGVASINPQAIEQCDGIDNNCDALVDEAGAVGESTFYLDFDGDGFGDPATAVTSCGPPAGYVSTGGDCDDLNADVNPAAIESCNGVDDDCNGAVDDFDPVANGALVCQASPTPVLVCDTGFSNCDGNITNGCETLAPVCNAECTNNSQCGGICFGCVGFFCVPLEGQACGINSFCDAAGVCRAGDPL
jgi:hypothetical protein